MSNENLMEKMNALFVLRNQMVNILFVVNVLVYVVLDAFLSVRANVVRYVDTIDLLHLDLVYNKLILNYLIKNNLK
jgi:hypothetical protein